MSPTCALCLHSGCSRCLFSLFLVLLDTSLCVCVYMLLFCAPSVGWLRWLFSFLSVHRGRLLLVSFIFGPSLRCIASVVCLGSLSAASLSLPFSLSLSPSCHFYYLLSSARPTTFAFAAPLSFTASSPLCLSGHLVLRLPHLPCVYALHPFLLYFFIFSQVGLPLAVSACAYPVLPLLHQVWLLPSDFRLSISSLCVCHSRILFYIPSAAPPPHIVLSYPLRCCPYL